MTALILRLLMVSEMCITEKICDDVDFAGAAKDSLFAIPFLTRIIGIYFHFKKDWKMASVFMVMFILMGYLTAFYQNQQQPQPRERDYFYVGAFFVYSIWIAFGSDVD